MISQSEVRAVLNAGVDQGSAHIAVHTYSYGCAPHIMKIFGMANSSAELFAIWDPI